MRLSSGLVALSGFVSVAVAFQPAVVVTNRHRSPTRCSSSRKGSDEWERLTPETSFGAEAVPEEQRPINEYLDVTKQPFFDWANLDTGSKGLATRLAILYGGIFGLVCYPISGATYTQDGYLLQKLAASNVGAMIFVTFFLGTC